MPELPEVETTRRGLEPLLINQRIRSVVVRQRALRLPVPRDLPRLAAGTVIRAVDRRGKYLLIDCGKGTLLLHLGMSGRLWIVMGGIPAEKHDHLDLTLENGTVVRLRDPRRFGLVLWTKGDPLRHPLLSKIGPEPLSGSFDGAWLHTAMRNRSAAIKQVLMDSRVVAGLGNIYANEALFRSGIHPKTPAKRIGLPRCHSLTASIRKTLQLAIGAGGSSLRDYVGSDGLAGNFQKHFTVYGRGSKPCLRCGTSIREIRQGQRATFYCPRCQPR